MHKFPRVRFFVGEATLLFLESPVEIYERGVASLLAAAAAARTRAGFVAKRREPDCSMISSDLMSCSLRPRPHRPPHEGVDARLR